ncbi:MAG: putative cysteine proteinase [Streblomastix strix]|uniref:Putative cysteine proteinase n=1 Tax=Streblomastix strix TaxID=222440 RepID=A0A5J4WRD9_9EUKA|nr:MAG: putative cysteine proteinase [Streblomastix strix]
MEKFAKQQKEQEQLALQNKEEQERIRRNELEEEQKRIQAEEEEIQEIIRIQKEEEERLRKQKLEEEERIKNEQEEEKRKRQAEEVRRQMQEIEERQRKEQEEKLRLQLLALENAQREEDERQKQLKRSIEKQTKMTQKLAFKLTSHQKDVLEKSSHFHGKHFPQWDDTIHAITVSNEQNPNNNQNRNQKVIFKKLEGNDDIFEWKERWNVVKQGRIDDCEFIAALIVMCKMEEKNKLLISDKLYPRDQNQISVYNPSCKYNLKLFINGCWRAIKIDEKSNKSSARSVEEGELWVSLLEGGYMNCVCACEDTCGIWFNDAVFAFCGWIQDSHFLLEQIWENDKEWEKIMRGMKENKVLIEVGIPQDTFPDSKDQMGLTSNHAYALLDMFKVGETKLLKIRNPHRGAVWSGKYSAWDNESWTTQLQAATGFTPVSENEAIRDGNFYIELNDFKKYFKDGDLCWNPELFPFKQEKIKLHQEDEVDFDVHWEPVPMLHINSGQINRQISITIKGQKQTKQIIIRKSIGITTERSWHDGRRNQLIKVISDAIGGESTAKAFYSVTRLILGTQIDLILTPRPGLKKYGNVININAFWEGDNEGGIHVSEVENATDEPQKNISVGGVTNILLYDDNQINKQLSQQTYKLQQEQISEQNEIVVKKRVVRVIPFCSPKHFSQRDAFTLESVGPLGYEVTHFKRHGPWQYSSHELSWSDIIKSKKGMDLTSGPRNKLFYILKAQKDTDLHLHFIILQNTESKLKPSAEFQVVKLSGPQLVYEQAIVLRLLGAQNRGQWDQNDKIIFTEKKPESYEKLYPSLFPHTDNTNKDGWFLSHSGSGHVDRNSYYGLCISIRQFTVDPLTVVVVVYVLACVTVGVILVYLYFTMKACFKLPEEIE